MSDKIEKLCKLTKFKNLKKYKYIKTGLKRSINHIYQTYDLRWQRSKNQFSLLKLQ